MREIEIDRGGRVLRAREVGEPYGPAVLYFHGTPGSRLDLSFGEHIAAERGVRLVTFDRPGYGGSTAAPFGLASIAADAHAVADGLGVARFATLGMSGGGPGALAAATVPGGRVIRVGVASGAGPFQLVPGGLDHLDDTDRAAVALLPADPAAAAAGFAAGFEPLIEQVAPAARARRLLSRTCSHPATANCWRIRASSPRSPPRCAAPGNQRRWLGQRLLDRAMGRRPERDPLPGAAVVRHRRPLRAARTRTVACGEPA
jgi:pimeloyl-ACP methyl ester carboxylesterase